MRPPANAARSSHELPHDFYLIVPALQPRTCTDADRGRGSAAALDVHDSVLAHDRLDLMNCPAGLEDDRGPGSGPGGGAEAGEDAVVVAA